MIKVVTPRKYLLDKPEASEYGLWMHTKATLEEATNFLLGGEKPLCRILNPSMRLALKILTNVELPSEMRWFDIELAPGDRILVMRKHASLSFMAEDQWEPETLISKFEFSILWYASEGL